MKTQGHPGKIQGIANWGCLLRIAERNKKQFFFVTKNPLYAFIDHTLFD